MSLIESIGYRDDSIGHSVRSVRHLHYHHQHTSLANWRTKWRGTSLLCPFCTTSITQFYSASLEFVVFYVSRNDFFVSVHSYPRSSPQRFLTCLMAFHERFFAVCFLLSKCLAENFEIRLKLGFVSNSIVTHQLTVCHIQLLDAWLVFAVPFLLPIVGTLEPIRQRIKHDGGYQRMGEIYIHANDEFRPAFVSPTTVTPSIEYTILLNEYWCAKWSQRLSRMHFNFIIVCSQMQNSAAFRVNKSSEGYQIVSG